MSFHVQFRRYRLPLRSVVRTAHEAWTEREGLVLRVEDSAGQVGFGEVAPIPAFGTETVEQAEAACLSLGEYPTAEQLDAVPERFGCVRQAIETAREEMAGAVREQSGAVAAGNESSYRAIAALLPTGRAAIAAVPLQAEAGFRMFKWKVGVADIADELAWLDDLCGVLPGGAKLRLDANGAWDRRWAERWFARCAERPVEFVEQPCFASAAQGAEARRRADDLLIGLAHDHPTPIALDESVVGAGDVGRWLAAGWPGWYVVKPSLLGDRRGALARLRSADATVVFSSALETAVGARAGLREAFAWTGEAKALGFGVWPLFADSRFDGPAAVPFIRAEDVRRVDPGAIWTALS